MRPDDAPLTHDAAVRLVREWHAAYCRRGETAAEWIAGGYPTDPAARGRWVTMIAGRASMAGMPAAWMPADRAEYRDALWKVGIGALRSGDPMPRELGRWFADAAEGRCPRPKVAGRPADTRMRDARIAVYAVRLEAAGFTRTRNDQPTARRPDRPGRSAADVIAAALGMPYKRVANIISGARFHHARDLIDILGKRSRKPAR